MMARLGRVGRVRAAHGKIGRIVGQRFIDGRGTACVGILTTRQGLRLVGGLPERQDVRAVRVLMIVGEAEALDPVAALAVSGADVPRAGSGVAAIAKR